MIFLGWSGKFWAPGCSTVSGQGLHQGMPEINGLSDRLPDVRQLYQGQNSHP